MPRTMVDPWELARETQIAQECYLDVPNKTCQATTRKGEQCSRPGRYHYCLPLGICIKHYCWQHRHMGFDTPVVYDHVEVYTYDPEALS